VSLVARHLEAEGIPTVVLGSARDVVEHCGVPRFLFTDFPLGNPCGRPFDADMQRAIVSSALDLLADARAPRTTVRSRERFASAPEAWRESFLHIDPAQREALRQAGERRRSRQRDVKASGGARGG